jgi:hypothetical protein
MDSGIETSSRQFGEGLSEDLEGAMEARRDVQGGLDQVAVRRSQYC